MTITAEREYVRPAEGEQTEHARKRPLSAKALGKKGEDAAVRYLHQHGYDILERNWTCFAGEADIIARDGEALVFIEVKTRSDIRQGFPSEAVDAKKRATYEKIALAYISESEFVDMPIRFDVVAIVAARKGRAVIRHHINAFAVA